MLSEPQPLVILFNTTSAFISTSNTKSSFACDSVRRRKCLTQVLVDFLTQVPWILNLLSFLNEMPTLTGFHHQNKSLVVDQQPYFRWWFTPSSVHVAWTGFWLCLWIDHQYAWNEVYLFLAFNSFNIFPTFFLASVLASCNSPVSGLPTFFQQLQACLLSSQRSLR